MKDKTMHSVRTLLDAGIQPWFYQRDSPKEAQDCMLWLKQHRYAVYANKSPQTLRLIQMKQEAKEYKKSVKAEKARLAHNAKMKIYMR